MDFSGDLRSLYRYGVGSPCSFVDPSGLLAIKRKVAGERLGTNGEFQVDWTFALDNDAPKDLALLQEVSGEIEIGGCKGTKHTAGKKVDLQNYVELIGFIRAGDTDVSLSGTKGNVTLLADNGGTFPSGIKRETVTDTWSFVGCKLPSCGIRLKEQGQLMVVTVTPAILDAISRWTGFVGRTSGIPCPGQQLRGEGTGSGLFMATDRTLKTLTGFGPLAGVVKPIQTLTARWSCPSKSGALDNKVTVTYSPKQT